MASGLIVSRSRHPLRWYRRFQELRSSQEGSAVRCQGSRCQRLCKKTPPHRRYWLLTIQRAPTPASLLVSTLSPTMLRPAAAPTALLVACLLVVPALLLSTPLLPTLSPLVSSWLLLLVTMAAMLRTTLPPLRPPSSPLALPTAPTALLPSPTTDLSSTSLPLVSAFSPPGSVAAL